jgi:hypothetical protein
MQMLFRRKPGSPEVGKSARKISLFFLTNRLSDFQTPVSVGKKIPKIESNRALAPLRA